MTEGNSNGEYLLSVEGVAAVYLAGFFQKYRPKKMRHTAAVRLFHWTHVFSIAALLCSGFHIAYPRSVPFFRMRSARLWHFVNAFIFMGSLAGRVGYSIRSKDYRNIFPRKKDLSLLPRYLRYQLFFSPKEPAFSKYNPIQKLYFTAWLPLFILQALTGLILYAPRRLGRLEAAFGGLGRTRKVHHLSAIMQGVTALTHIFFTATAGTEKLKSIFTGYKALGKK